MSTFLLNGEIEIPFHDDIRVKLSRAVQQTLNDDWDLIALGAHEQSIAHRIAVHLEPLFPGFHIDCEYNRNKYATKVFVGEFGQKPKAMRPDIIVHRRNTPENVLALEMKANANTKKSNDRKKLKALGAQDGGYLYVGTAFIHVENGIRDIRKGVLVATITWFDVDDDALVERVGEKETLSNSERQSEVEAIARKRSEELKRKRQVKKTTKNI